MDPFYFDDDLEALADGRFPAAFDNANDQSISGASAQDVPAASPRSIRAHQTYPALLGLQPARPRPNTMQVHPSQAAPLGYFQMEPQRQWTLSPMQYQYPRRMPPAPSFQSSQRQPLSYPAPSGYAFPQQHSHSPGRDSNSRIGLFPPARNTLRNSSDPIIQPDYYDQPRSATQAQSTYASMNFRAQDMPHIQVSDNVSRAGDVLYLESNDYEEGELVGYDEQFHVDYFQPLAADEGFRLEDSDAQFGLLMESTDQQIEVMPAAGPSSQFDAPEHGLDINMENYDFDLGLSVWTGNLETLEDAQELLREHAPKLKLLQLAKDDAEDVEQQMSAHAKALFEALSETPEQPPAAWPKELKEYYYKQQANAVKAIKRVLSASHGKEDLEAHCMEAVAACVQVHKEGVPVLHFEPPKTSTSSAGVRTHLSLICSERVKALIEAASESKLICRDIADAKPATIQELARSPFDCLQRKLDNCQTNFTKDTKHKFHDDMKARATATGEPGLIERFPKRTRTAREKSRIARKSKLGPAQPGSTMSTPSKRGLDQGDGESELMTPSIKRGRLGHASANADTKSSEGDHINAANMGISRALTPTRMPGKQKKRPVTTNFQLSNPDA